MPKTLKTPQSVWTKVFRRIVQQLETDPAIKRMVGLDNLRSWKGVPGDKGPFAPTSTTPVMRLTPAPQNVDWYSPDRMVGVLVVQVELSVMSRCLDDVTDLWDLLPTALSPNGTGSTGGGFSYDLAELGAETGEIVFGAPAIDPFPANQPEGAFAATGSFHLRLLRPV